MIRDKKNRNPQISNDAGYKFCTPVYSITPTSTVVTLRFFSLFKKEATIFFTIFCKKHPKVGKSIAIKLHT